MIDTILSNIFTSGVVENLGDSYELIYSWSVFAVVCGLVLSGVVLIYAFSRWLLRWFR